MVNPMTDQDLLANLEPIEAHVFNLPAPPNLEGFDPWVQTWAIELITAGTPWDAVAAVGLLYRAADNEIQCMKNYYTRRIDAWCDAVLPEDREMIRRIAVERMIDLRAEVEEIPSEHSDERTQMLNDLEIRIREAGAVARCLERWGSIAAVLELLVYLTGDFSELRPF
jgi:hypothetical protein